MTVELTIKKAIESRRSVRAFLERQVPEQLIRECLILAAQAPSGANMQPWNVDVLTGNSLKKLTSKLYQVAINDQTMQPDYRFYPDTWREPYLGRRRKIGWDLYKSVGIERGEKQKMAEQQAKNYLFFGAPVGVIVTIDRDMGQGSWIDIGIFIQTFMLAAQGFGLGTCPQGAFANYPKIVAQILDLPENRRIICGIAVGYADNNAAVNQFETQREQLNQFAKFWY